MIPDATQIEEYLTQTLAEVSAKYAESDPTPVWGSPRPTSLPRWQLELPPAEPRQLALLIELCSDVWAIACNLGRHALPRDGPRRVSMRVRSRMLPTAITTSPATSRSIRPMARPTAWPATFNQNIVIDDAMLTAAASMTVDDVQSVLRGHSVRHELVARDVRGQRHDRRRDGDRGRADARRQSDRPARAHAGRDVARQQDDEADTAADRSRARLRLPRWRLVQHRVQRPAEAARLRRAHAAALVRRLDRRHRRVAQGRHAQHARPEAASTPANHATATLYAYTPWVLVGSGGTWLAWNVTRKYERYAENAGLTQ